MQVANRIEAEAKSLVEKVKFKVQFEEDEETGDQQYSAKYDSLLVCGYGPTEELATEEAKNQLIAEILAKPSLLKTFRK